ncbi:major facilitator superfamily domain-containing protein [Globomyces pollinis-pini]|nr:major facilitator superfamily domain-containing protein [Globomyces pollinis-pini]
MTPLQSEVVHNEETPLIKKVEQTPLPWNTMFIICLTILAEPISLSILFPFVYFMVKDFGTIKEENIGYSVGFISSAFSAAQLLTSVGWGWFSDKYGRRPAILIGLIGNSMSMICFGFSKSLAWAILTRFTCGFLNGNIGVAKSMLGEITDKTNQAKAFSLIGLNYGIGMIVGPSLGGLLADPVANLPFFGNLGFITTFLTNYPYFLPCLCSSLITLVGFMIGYLYLPETCQRLLAERAADDTTLIYESIQEESSSSTLSITSGEISLSDCDSDYLDTHDLIPEITQNEKQGIGFRAIACSIAFMLLALENIVFVESFPLWAVATPGIGLGFSAQKIGACLSFMGIPTVLCQIFFYPWISTKATPLQIFRVPILFLFSTFIFLPMISTFVAPNEDLAAYLWPSLLIFMGIRAFSEQLSFTSVNILVF